jgi:hypothetical protein
MASAPSRSLPLTLAAALVVASTGLGCDEGSVARDPDLGGDLQPRGNGGSGNGGSGSGGSENDPVAPATRVDLLFLIDNSISMIEKHALLQSAVPELIARLTNPGCVDGDGNATAGAEPGEPCPGGGARELAPIESLHVGVITSSLGDATAEVVCPESPDNERYREERTDAAHLLGSRPRAAGVASNEHGFLE